MKLKLGNKLQNWVLLPSLIIFLWAFPAPSLKWSPIVSTAHAGFFNNDLETFEEIINLVANKYVYSPDHKKLFAAAIEQNHYEKGIIWPASIAPFQLALVPINMHKSVRLREAVVSFYEELIANNIDVLIDDRNERPGVMFSDMELIGIPYRFVFSEKGLDTGEIEYKARQDNENQNIQIKEAITFIKEKINNN